MNLWINLYDEKNNTRLEELEEALECNLRCKYIKRVFAICDSRLKVQIKHDKLRIVRSDWWNNVTDKEWRPTYQDFFSYVNYFTEPNEINIIANTDISFDETLVHVLPIFEYPQLKICATMSRRELDDEIKNFGADAWIFHGKIEPNVWGGFNLGVPACDWRINLELKKAGYTLVNPSFDVRARHHHASDIRNWTNADYVEGTPYGRGHVEPQKMERIKTIVKSLLNSNIHVK